MPVWRAEGVKQNKERREKKKVKQLLQNCKNSWSYHGMCWWKGCLSRGKQASESTRLENRFEIYFLKIWTLKYNIFEIVEIWNVTFFNNPEQAGAQGCRAAERKPMRFLTPVNWTYRQGSRINYFSSTCCLLIHYMLDWEREFHVVGVTSDEQNVALQAPALWMMRTLTTGTWTS